MGKRLLYTAILLAGWPLGMSAQNDSLSFRERYEAFRKKAQGEYADFRAKANKDYADFMEKAWKHYGVEAPVAFPIKQWDEPLSYNKEQAKWELLERKRQLEKEQKDLSLKRQQQQQQQQQLEEKARQLQAEQQRLAEEKARLEQERQNYLEEKKKRDAEQLQSSQDKENELAERKRQMEEKLAEQKRLLDEKARKQAEQQRLLDEQRSKQEEQERLLAEERRKQAEQQKQLEKQQKELEKGREIVVKSIPVIKKTIPQLQPQLQPQPVSPVKENKTTVKPNDFEYYGTPLEARWGGLSLFRLANTSEQAMANAYRELTSSTYNNLLYDCLEIRKEYDLCDWAYYKMLEKLAESACGKGTNEAIFLQGVLYQQSGYMMRFALDEKRHLHLLLRLDGMAYDCGYTVVDGLVFYLLDGSRLKNLTVCTGKYDGEKEMNPDIRKLPKLKLSLSPKRSYYSGEAPMKCVLSLNKNVVDFFNDCPSTFRDKNVMTNWANYANTPVTEEVRTNLYPQLREQIGNVPRLIAATMLLKWVQTGLKYGYDERIWGRERAFFAEETLYYPMCDCEDRAILYSHLVRDLLGLDVILIYHPEHVYTAVCFDEEVKGDYIMVDGRKFTVADPTFYNADVGKTMSRMDNSKAKVILLDRNL